MFAVISSKVKGKIINLWLCAKLLVLVAGVIFSFSVIAQPLVISGVSPAVPSCGANDGGIVVQISGNFGQVTYSIDNGVNFQASATFSGLSAGLYQVVALDSAGFSDTLVYVLAGDGNFIGSVNAVDPLCNGASNGELSVTLTGGSAPFLYSFDGGGVYGSSATATGLPTGIYNVVVQDASYCFDTASVVLTEPAVVSFTHSVINASCPANDGSITIAASGGSGALQYSINGGTSFQAGNAFTGLAVGVYTIVVQDANGCTSTSDVILGSAPGFGPDIIMLNHINPLCNGSANGSITVIAMGATPLTYSIDGGSTFTGSNVFTSLTPGSYPVIAADGNGCLSGSLVVITEPGVLQSVITAFNETCVGGDGSVNLFTSGGTSPYQYSFDGGVSFSSSSSLLNQSGGSFNIVVTDNNGCTENATVTLTSGSGPTIQGISVVNASCPGVNDGSIDISAISQSGSIAYSIDGGLVMHPIGSFSNLTTGTYDVYLVDANGCSTSQTVIISGPVTPFADFTADVNSGFIPFTVNFTNNSIGATGNDWSFGVTGATANTTDASYTYTTGGTYVVMLVVTDGVCNDTATVTIEVDGEPGITIPNIFTPNNDGVNDFFFAQPVGITQLSGVIYNRYGEIVYLWEGPEGGWDGRTIPAGVPCSDGVYFYLITATDLNGAQIEEKGTVHLLRTTNPRQR